mmetsp:Transcript_41400/g.81819  ORF Transcript_41400/g.81819 Transcript_41400/m.81819 type:complete len:383 (+) Transcript_41400:2653-3801(+)
MVKQGPGLACNLFGVRDTSDEGGEVAMGKQNSLWPACGTTREKDHGNVLLVDRLPCSGRPSMLAEQALAHHNRRDACHLEVVPDRLRRCIHEHKPGFRIFSHAEDPISWPRNIHWNHCEAGLQNSDERWANHLPSAHAQDHALPILHAIGDRGLGLDGCCHRVGARAEALIGSAESLAGHRQCRRRHLLLLQERRYGSKLASIAIGFFREACGRCTPSPSLLEEAFGEEWHLPHIAPRIRRTCFEEDLERSLLLTRCALYNERVRSRSSLRPRGPLTCSERLAVPDEDYLRRILALARWRAGRCCFNGSVGHHEQVFETHLLLSGLNINDLGLPAFGEHSDRSPRVAVAILKHGEHSQAGRLEAACHAAGDLRRAEITHLLR